MKQFASADGVGDIVGVYGNERSAKESEEKTVIENKPLPGGELFPENHRPEWHPEALARRQYRPRYGARTSCWQYVGLSKGLSELQKEVGIPIWH